MSHAPSIMRRLQTDPFMVENTVCVSTIGQGEFKKLNFQINARTGPSAARILVSLLPRDGISRRKALRRFWISEVLCTPANPSAARMLDLIVGEL